MDSTPYPANVRIATAQDEPEILRLMRMAHAEQPIASLSEKKLHSIIELATAKNPKDRKGIIGVIDGPKGLEAYFCAIFSEWWFSDECRIEELSNFVHPDHRKGQHFDALMQFGKWVSEYFGLTLLMGIMASERLIPKIRLYERKIKPLGGLFYHNPQGGVLAEASRC